ncbi:MAG: [protein-PII] uridylyltransferase [Betaproteobacteria bacterium]|nr:MAG: [protein-PII] uridylyltransferase [Betaproteobacteria bacterium]
MPSSAPALHPLAHYKAMLQEGQQALKSDYQSQGDAAALLRQRCSNIDKLLVQIWQDQQFPSSLALVAVGGYGRGELYPASDIDLLLLLPKEPDEALKGKLEQLVGLFWDIGLEIGHSVRTLEECLQEAAGDITVQTALIEARLLSGDQALFSRFQQGLAATLDPQTFFKAKKLEQDERYIRFHETPYALEPNLKESPGGLRDLQVVLWVAQAAGLGRTWQDLERGGFITAEETQALIEAQGLLETLRVRLHLLTGRREDRLLFDVQTPMAADMGIEATPTRRSSEQLMQRYYRNAKLVTQLNIILMQNIGAAIFPAQERAPEAIDANFQKANGLLDVSDEEVFQRRPGALLEAFLLLQQNPDLKGMTARTLRALWRARLLINDEFRADPANRACFLKLFQQKQGIVHEFRRMNQYGILGRYIPAFGAVVGQMQHDLFHAYTVDQHILQVMRNMRRFTMEEFAHEYPLCSRLVAGFDRPWLLYIATLFHDIAKGRGGDHSSLGMADARAFCENHGLAPEDTELVEWLVGQHLVMSQVAQKEDITDPEVVAAFAARVRDERHLTALYLLTVADIRGTSPKVWNAWKGKLLEDLYGMTLRLLEKGVTPEPHGVIEERQEEALRLLRYFALSDTVHQGLWKQLDTVYFLRHSAEEIAWHTRCLHYRIHHDEPLVKARLRQIQDCSEATETLQVMVYTRDQPDLFARLCGFFGRAGFNIVDAKIHTTRHGYALDSFILLDVSNREIPREMASYVEHELTEALLHPGPPEAPPTGRLSRQVRHFPIAPQVSLLPDDRGHCVLSIVAADRPGLLFSVAQTLARHGAGLQTAKIATLGERAEDTFLVSGGDLDQSSKRIRLETELLEMLQV